MDNLFFIAQAASPAGGADGSSQLWLMGLLVVGLVFYYFMLIRPQSKKRKEMQLKLKSIAKGDKVVTIGGAHGKVVAVKDDTVTIRVDDKAEITFDKNAIATVVSKNSDNSAEAKDSAKDSAKDNSANGEGDVKENEKK